MRGEEMKVDASSGDWRCHPAPWNWDWMLRVAEAKKTLLKSRVAMSEVQIIASRKKKAYQCLSDAHIFSVLK